MADAAFPGIVARDHALPLPPTSYVPQTAPADKSFTITLHEGQTYIGNGVVYDGFLIDGQVPGPTLIVDEGDIVEINVRNEGTVPHGASIHAAYTQTSKYLGSIAPGQTKTLRFLASYPGVYLYHCAPGGHAIPMHVLAGQYGMMVVRPKAQPAYQLEKDIGRAPDLELYLVQHELYASGKDAIEGNAHYTMFNGRLFRYVEEPVRVRPGDFVRIYFLNVGPNLLSTFHIVGIIWDYVYWQGHPQARWPGGQTVTAGPSDSWVIEFRIPPEEGAYTMLSHAVGSTSRGAIGLLVASAGHDTPSEILADGPRFTDAEMKENLEKANRIISPFRPGTHPVDRPVIYGPDIEDVYISIIGNSYSPKVVQIRPGTRVTWVNEDVFTYLAGEYSGIHNVAATDMPPGDEGFVSPLLAHGETFTHTFTTEGAYSYICTPHPYMEGRIIVKGAPAP
ncbi:MAG TPA: multicopper oxidase domain-containing protein, partial [Kiritimatiellia bacterium]|nr:multicopper oxidase domain-containing protein [Kiritimatiellia bacterium]